MQEPKHASEPTHPVSRAHVSAQELPSTQKRHLGHLFKKQLSSHKHVDTDSTRRNAYVSDIINVQSLLNVRAIETQRRKRRTSLLADRIVINVSGDRFETHQSTLKLYPNTLLGNRKRRQYYYDEKHHEYFFDRNRASFEAILYYYQSNGRLRRPSYVPMDTFLEEVTFFELGRDALQQLRKDENVEEVKKVLLPRNHIRRVLWATMEYPEYSWLANLINIISMFIILISTVGLAVESLPQYTNRTSLVCHEEYHQFNTTAIFYLNDSNDTLQHSIRATQVCQAFLTDPFFIIQTVCIAFFTLEFLLRLISTPSILYFIKNAMNWIDLVAIVPFYVILGIRLAGGENEIQTSTYAGLQLLRMLRFARVLKFYRICKSVKSLRVLVSTIKESVPDFLIMIAMLTLLAFLFGAGVYFAEYSSNRATFDSIPKATYWGIITITSVGYGDLTPITPVGRVLACLCALFGTATIGILVSSLVDRYQRVFTRKRYINEDAIDFDDYSEDDNDEIRSRHSNQSIRRQNSGRIENPDARAKEEAAQAKFNELFDEKDNDASESPHELLPPVTHPLSRQNSGVHFIVGYIDTEEQETSQELIDRISSIVAEKQTADNGMMLSLVLDVPLTDPSSTNAEFYLASHTDDSDDTEGFTEINTGAGSRSKGNVLKCFRRKSSTSDKVGS